MLLHREIALCSVITFYTKHIYVSHLLAWKICKVYEKCCLCIEKMVCIFAAVIGNMPFRFMSQDIKKTPCIDLSEKYANFQQRSLNSRIINLLSHRHTCKICAQKFLSQCPAQRGWKGQTPKTPYNAAMMEKHLLVYGSLVTSTHAWMYNKVINNKLHICMRSHTE